MATVADRYGILAPIDGEVGNAERAHQNAVGTLRFADRNAR
jgi:hypothetical protein